MDHYLDVHVEPDPEFPTPMLLGALVSKLHRGLVALNANDIGISFPEYESKPALGSVLRVHAEKTRLQALMDTRWLKGIRDHIGLSDISFIPGDVLYRVVRRRQYKTNVDRLRRRRMRRHQQAYEEAARHIPESVERRVNTPFVIVRSRSSGQTFSLFVEHGELRSDPQSGSFSTYGLSGTATIPWF